MKENKFLYTYSAPTEEERREIEDIKRQYSGEKQEKDKLTRLRELDGRVKRFPTAFGITLGVFGVLVFGTGLAMVLEWGLLAWGIVVMAVGCVPTGLARFSYKRLLERNRKKYGQEIVKLSEELLNEQSKDGVE